ncbi:TrkH family potassium uptake protein [Wenyingzhuangia sp. 2_MG-2023]|uniref:TrkH family potassium uptake protein n=1 Tax=Wenyingzhuangia sp. 2_MG-2023 TaxID=3062639 RepID=UPI0026E222B1|nr:TrkH family potassium uptake protein [Wenyingzhuangia sp. 2_MG-2023]MDO6736387.1 TrkH family potassium uptake protein [Wenyingzhuangia sp. 2_MG-2023]MDO6801302.1 TrkH family potassium uptake protein [Wenyingzhuangia sp. 1_MG-2023]
MKGLNFKIIASFMGLTSMMNGFFMLLSEPFSWYHHEEASFGILSAGLLTIALGFLLWFFNKNAEKNIQKRDGYLIVTLGWLMLTLTGTLPYLLTGTITSFPDAVFETISGYSTTGASILTDIESVSKGVLFWRSATHWIGGMGIIVLTVAILPLLGIGGMQLFVAEAPGPSTDKLHPRITQTAKRLWLIYFSFTIAEFLLLKVAGMSWFDAINHAMATLSTGGFSTKNNSLAYWNGNPLIQYIIIGFMFVAGANFVLSYFALKGKPSKIYKDDEFRYYFLISVSVTIIITMLIVFFQEPSLQTTIYHPKPYGEFESAFRHAAFQVVSVITTTGFVSADFTMWNYLATALMFSLFFIGGSAGSTSGGVKVVRHVIMIKNSMLELKKQLHPKAIISVRYNGSRVSRVIIFNILSFFVIYMLIFILSTIVLTLLGLDFLSALGAAASCLGNIGPALGSLSPVDNFAHLSDTAKLFCSFLMLLGRLELFTVLIVLTPYFWKSN